jgi:hypothetical protein
LGAQKPKGFNMVANIDGDHMPEGDDIYLREMTYT